MRRLLTSSFAIIAMSITAFAAPPQFEVQSPTWTKIAISTNPDGINIRKSPSTSAPKLVYDENKIEDYDVPLACLGFWSSAPARGSVHAIPFNGPAPIVRESNGWYEIEGIGANCSGSGWVSAKLCKAIEPAPITRQSKENSPWFVWLPDNGNGTYAIQLDYNEMDGCATFYVGRLKDGKIICPYMLHCFYAEPGDMPQIRQEGEGFILSFKPDYYNEDEYTLDLRRFSNNLLNQIVKLSTKLPDDHVIY